jgi:hypothetical protein
VARSFGTWNQQEYPGGDASFNPASMSGPPPFFRDESDYLRSGWRRTPEAQYPDGYLQTIHTRREDRLLDGLKQRQAKGPAIRGIHKGEKLDARDYYWQPEFNPESGLQTQAAGVETFDGIVVPRYVSPGLVNDPMASEFMSPRRANVLARQGGGQGMTPPWSTPQAPVQPGMVNPGLV